MITKYDLDTMPKILKNQIQKDKNERLKLEHEN